MERHSITSSNDMPFQIVETDQSRWCVRIIFIRIHIQIYCKRMISSIYPLESVLQAGRSVGLPTAELKEPSLIDGVVCLCGQSLLLYEVLMGDTRLITIRFLGLASRLSPPVQGVLAARRLGRVQPICQEVSKAEHATTLTTINGGQ